MKAIPMAKKAGSTVPAVIIGCHAGNFCCLNFVSVKYKTQARLETILMDQKNSSERPKKCSAIPGIKKQIL